MKRLQRGIVILLLATAIGAGAASAKSHLMTIQVKRAQLRSAPNYFSQVKGEALYAERVLIVREQGAWTLIRKDDASAEGWINSSALTAKRLQLAATGDAPVAASTEEQALAGKGFNSKVEAQFKARNKQADFATVDRMESLTVPEREVARFIAKGDLLTAKGGAK